MNINIDLIYPVGSVYITTNNVNPKVLFGGEWEQTCKSRLLAGAGSNLANTDNSYGTYTEGSKSFEAGDRIGESSHTLTIDEMPSHTHKGYISGGSITGITQAQAGGYNSAENRQDLTSTGGSQAHNNMPPIEVFYIWKRIA